jgi:ammonium transporter, Amt family
MTAFSCRAALGAAVACIASAAPAFAQQAAQTTKIDSADTAWMIVATALVLMMTIPGLALFYAGMVRKKNVLATMAQSLAAVALISVMWIAFGYSLAFVGDGPMDRHARAGLPCRHDDGKHQPGREDHP